MAFVLPNPIVGGTVAGFTTPGYTHATDSIPNGKQVYVHTLGGTQPGATAHSVASPFTVSMMRPANLQVLSSVDPVTGLLRSVPMNVYKVHVRKGTIPLAGQPAKVSYMRIEIGIPAGSDTADVPNIKAMVSCGSGAVYALSTEIVNTLLSGVV